MHNEVLEWVSRTLQIHPQFIINARVIEFGSRDWNGNPRHLFHARQYVGIDLISGPCVDIVADCSDLRALYNDGVFDVVLCLEVLEHSNRKSYIWGEMLRVLCKGGLAIITAGAPDRPEHDGGTDFYENVTAEWMAESIDRFSKGDWEIGPNEAGTPDIRAWGIK